MMFGVLYFDVFDPVPEVPALILSVTGKNKLTEYTNINAANRNVGICRGFRAEYMGDATGEAEGTC